MKRPPSRSRRGTITPRPPASLDWQPIERAAESWSGLRITEDDLTRVKAWLDTHRAQRLQRELSEFQETLRRGVKTLEWAPFDPATLMGLLLIAEHLREARDRFPPGAEGLGPVGRWTVLLHRLLLAAEDAKLPVLSLAQRAITAVDTSNSANRELFRRVEDRLGFAAAAVPLLQWFGDDDLATASLDHVRRAVERKVPRRDYEEIDAAVLEEIARRRRGENDRTELARAVSAIMASLPADPRPSRWDYVAKDAAQRIRRKDQRRQHRAPGKPGPDEAAEPADTQPTPDHVAALREILRQPGMLAALRAEVTSSDQKAGRSGASKRRRDKLRRAIEDLIQP